MAAILVGVRRLQYKQTMGYLGPKGTFSHCAAHGWIQGQDITLKPYGALSALVSGVENNEADLAIVPVENSAEGSVGVVLDLLAHHTGINIIGEMQIPVSHNLLVKPGTKLHQITRLLSHPQAIGQCRQWLALNLPQGELIETASTALAAQQVAQGEQNWAAIGTPLAGQLYNLCSIEENINDYANNITRFLIISTQKAPLCHHCKTSMEFTLPHNPGALYNALGEFAQRGINLTRIESRPTKQELGQYRFFVDFTWHYSEELIKELVGSLNKQVTHLRILGSYPAVNHQ